MGLFSSKKKEKGQQRSDLPPLRFPELPSEDMPNYPSLQQGMPVADMDSIRGAVGPKLPPLQQQFIPQEPVMQIHEDMERPLFVRIEKYRDVMETLNELKERLKDAGDVLKELQRIKEEEENELASWHSDLETIKEKLMAIDKTLFESG